MSDDRASAAATRDHITLLTEKRDRLMVAVTEAFEAVLPSIARGTWSPTEAVEWWQWSRTLGIPHAAVRTADALGTNVSTLRQWTDYAPDEWCARWGLLPLGHQAVLPKGVACVYLLLGSDRNATCLYVGQTVNLRLRLKDHWRQGRIPATRWEAIPCSSPEEAVRLEADLIYQHQPAYNTSGRRSRGGLRAH